MTSTQGEGDNLFFHLYDFFLPHPTPGLVFWEPWWCYIYYTTVSCWQSLLWISTIVKAPFKSTCFLHYAKKITLFPPLAKMTPSLTQSQTTFWDRRGAGCSQRHVFHKFDPHKTKLFYMSPSSQDMTLYIWVLIMQTLLRGRAVLQAEIISLADLNLSEQS